MAEPFRWLFVIIDRSLFSKTGTGCLSRCCSNHRSASASRARPTTRRRSECLTPSLRTKLRTNPETVLDSENRCSNIVRYSVLSGDTNTQQSTGRQLPLRWTTYFYPGIVRRDYVQSAGCPAPETDRSVGPEADNGFRAVYGDGRVRQLRGNHRRYRAIRRRHRGRCSARCRRHRPGPIGWRSSPSTERASTKWTSGRRRRT